MIRNGIRTDLDGSLSIPDHCGLEMKAVKDSHHPHCSWMAPRITGSRGKKKGLVISYILLSSVRKVGRRKREEPSPIMSSYKLLNEVLE